MYNDTDGPAEVGKLDAELAALREKRAKVAHGAKIVAWQADLLVCIEKYSTLAEAAMQALGEAAALHLHLSSLGHDPSLFGQGLMGSALGSFRNHPLTGNPAEVIRRERARLAAA